MTAEEIIERLKETTSGAKEIWNDSAKAALDKYGPNDIGYLTSQIIADIWDSISRDINNPAVWFSDEMMAKHKLGLDKHRESINGNT